MTKAEFFNICDRGKVVGGVLRHRDFHGRPEVIITGKWPAGNTSVRLYQPQLIYEDVGLARVKCDVYALQFARWLKDWRSKQ